MTALLFPLASVLIATVVAAMALVYLIGPDRL